MIIYNVFMISWSCAYQSNVFYHRYNSMLDKNSIQLLGCGQLSVSSTSGFPWWSSVLQGSDWIPPRKCILDESSVLFCLFMILLDRILSPGQLIISALMLAIDLSPNQNINLSSIKRKTPTIMGWIYMVNTRFWSFAQSRTWLKWLSSSSMVI